MSSKMTVLCKGIQVKLNRGEDLEVILASYTKLTEVEKDTIREYFADKEGM